MPTVEVEGSGTFDVEEGKRLVLAIEEDAEVGIYGGYVLGESVLSDRLRRSGARQDRSLTIDGSLYRVGGYSI